MIVHPTVLSVAQQYYRSDLPGIALAQSSLDPDIIGFYPCLFSQEFLSLDLYEFSSDFNRYEYFRFGLISKLGLSLAKLSGWFVPVDDFYEYMPYKNDPNFMLYQLSYDYFQMQYGKYCQNSRTALYSNYVSYSSQTLTYSCSLASINSCSINTYNIVPSSSQSASNRRCILKGSYSCSDSVRGTGKQITYSFNDNGTPYSFNCSGTTDKAYSGGKEITCPLNDDYFAEEDACDNCNNQGICLGETVRKCSCFEGWSGTKCEIRQNSTFDFKTEELPTNQPPAWDSVSNGSSNILWRTCLLIFTGLLLQLFMAI
jgi:hypothetical protein